MENYNTYNSDSTERHSTTYGSDQTRQSDTSQQDAQLLYQAMKQKGLVRSGANWFYWIAGLSLINSILFFTNSNFGFLAGLGATKVIDWYMSGTQTGMIVGLGLSVAIAAGFAACGYFGHKTEYRWAYMGGMVLYALDGAIFLALGSWLSLAFHGYALFCLYAGLRASLELSKIEQQLRSFTPARIISK